MKNVFIKALITASIMSVGLCFTGCDSAEQEQPTEVKQVQVAEQEQEVVTEEHGVIYYVDAEVIYTETFDDATTVACQDAYGERYAFFGEGFEVGDKVQLEMDDNYTENDIYDDKIVDVMIY